MTSGSPTDSHLNYIEKYLVAEIVGKLAGETLERYEAHSSGGLDGFMSALYTITLWTKTETGTKERLLIAKFMKGDSNFRESSKAYVQFANEIFIYAKVLPIYEQVLKEACVSDVNVDDWIAHCYVAKFGHIEGLSSTPTERDSVLVLANLKPDGYKLGPHLYLPRDHLLKMAQKLGQYHAMTYVLRLREDPRLDQLKAGIIPLPFCYVQNPAAEQTNLFHWIYRAGFDRFFLYFDRTINDGSTFDYASQDDLRLIDNLRRLREKYFENPTHLLEHLRTGVELTEEDQRFSAILHGDFNRNNVLFSYKKNEVGDATGTEFGEADDVKMIDFQELRYGSPALDLSFFMFINTNIKIREAVWPEILECYHSNMYQTLSSVLKAGISDPQQLSVIEQKLQQYNYDRFYAHFSKFAFYGVIICMHFLPWLLCKTEECERLSQLFETDMQGKEFHQLSIDAGGDIANKQILEVIRYASRMGYMDSI